MPKIFNLQQQTDATLGYLKWVYSRVVVEAQAVGTTVGSGPQTVLDSITAEIERRVAVKPIVVHLNPVSIGWSVLPLTVHVGKIIDNSKEAADGG